LYPESFEATWKGRVYLLFFLWIFLLEMILSWEGLQTQRISDMKLIRESALIIGLSAPTLYVIVANFYGLNYMIENLAKQGNVPWASMMPLSIEYLVFAALFALIIMLEYGTSGLKDFSIPYVFLGTIGVIYVIDNMYPEGRFTPFQILVPTTTMFAASVLNLIGYQTRLVGIVDGMPTLFAWNSKGSWGAAIAWPCSGIESLIIYTVTILLFLKKSPIPWAHRVIYFVIGAIVTYFINIMRIVTIFVIGINGGDVWAFHRYYGQLYSVTWIMSYPLIIIGSRTLWGKIKNWKTKIALLVSLVNFLFR
jgi:thaumarchaeosortase